MSPFSASAGRPSGRGPLNSLLCSLAFSLLIALPGLAQGQKKQTLKVCITDQDGSKVTNKVAVTLFNTSARIDTAKGAGADGCFTSGNLPLDVGKSYFVVAVKENRLASAELKLNDGGSEIGTVNLRLAPAAAAVARPDIEICAEDEGTERILIERVSAPDGGRALTHAEPRIPGCARLQLSGASQYQLNLITRRPTASPGASMDAALTWLAVILAAIAIASTFVLVIALRSVQKLRSAPAGGKLIVDIHEKVKSLSQDLGEIKIKFDEWRAAAPWNEPPRDDDDGELQPFEAGEDYSEGGSMTGVGDVTGDVVVSRQQQREDAPPGAAPAPEQHNLRIAEAKRKYGDLVAGLHVDHFYLMPVGSSSASQMVEGVRIELREQDHGTYVGFPLSKDAQGSVEAWVFPRPGYRFTPDVFSAVFPHLKAQEYKSGDIEPKRALSIEPKLWKIE